MKKLSLFYILFVLLLASVIGYNGCSQLDKNAVTAPGVEAHPDGWLVPSSANFHGKHIAANKWDMSECKTCHGVDFKGGNTGASCMKCHTSADGPQACGTCHGNRDHANPPKSLSGDTVDTYYGVGMHMSHLYSSDWAAPVACSECHTVPESFLDSSHIGPNPDGRAELNFGPLARTQHGAVPNPIYDQNTNTCANNYCHGKFYGGNQTSAPKWTDAGTVYCGTCHGDPSTGDPMPRLGSGQIAPPHLAALPQCYLCHGSVIDSNMTIIAPLKHINGEINFNVGQNSKHLR
jgi:predicted CxxxxCH...CXXCH cytochrome family protein